MSRVCLDLLLGGLLGVGGIYALIFILTILAEF